VEAGLLQETFMPTSRGASRRVHDADRDHWWSVADIAEMRGVTEATVRRWIATGALPAEKVDGSWHISRGAFRVFMKKRRDHLRFHGR
jgi:excisionase family DNA binding protein